MNRSRRLAILMIGLLSGWPATAWSTSTLVCSGTTFDVMFHVGSDERGRDEIADASLFDARGLVASVGAKGFISTRIDWPAIEPPFEENELSVRFEAPSIGMVVVQSKGVGGTIRVADYREPVRCDWSR